MFLNNFPTCISEKNTIATTVFPFYMHHRGILREDRLEGLCIFYSNVHFSLERVYDFKPQFKKKKFKLEMYGQPGFNKYEFQFFGKPRENKEFSCQKSY